MNLIKLQEKVQFGEQFRPQILSASPDAKVPMICLEPGQEIPAHPSGTGVFYVLEGKGIMYLNGKNRVVKREVVLLPKDQKEALGAQKDWLLLLFILVERMGWKNLI